jgi:carbamoyltransferase
MKHWGITALNHGSALAVFDNFKLTSWQTFNNDWPELDQEAPDGIYWYERPWLKKARQIYAGQYQTALDFKTLPRGRFKKQGFGSVPITYTAHHASHASAGYYTSPFNHCAVIVLDAIGEFECATIWEGRHGELHKVWSRNYPNSLGLFYSAFTQFVGLTPIKNEHLLEQMAKQGNPVPFRKILADYFGAGIVDLDYNFHRGVLDWPGSKPANLQEQCDLAAAVQERFEIEVGRVARLAKQLTGSDCLVYMGGCAMNSRANRNEVEPLFKYRWSLPDPGDASSALGAVLYHTKHRQWDYSWNPIKHIAINL